MIAEFWKDHTREQLEEFLNSHPLVLLELGTEWCGPCRTFKEFMRENEELFVAGVKKTLRENGAEEEAVQVACVDCDEFEGFARAFDLDAYPTFVVKYKGWRVRTFSGLKNDPLSLLKTLVECVVGVVVAVSKGKTDMFRS